MVAQHTAKASWLRAQKLELTSAGSPTPRSCSRPLSPRTEVRREDPERVRHRQTTAFGTRAEARAFDPKGNASFTPDTNTSSHWATCAGRHLRQARIKRQAPDKPARHPHQYWPQATRLSSKHNGHTATDGDREGVRHQPGGPPADAGRRDRPHSTMPLINTHAACPRRA